MSNESGPGSVSRTSLLRNWTSLTGVLVMAGSLFAFLLLFALELVSRAANPYMGILTFLVAPAFLVGGLLLTFLGMFLERRQILKSAGVLPPMVINLSRTRDRKALGIFVVICVTFLLLTALGSYHTYHFTESVTFCGQACHTVMKPEMVTYQHGAHARVSCTECHIGRGATWFVRSKLSGTYQVYATLANKYPRPVPTPIKNLRPAQETCEQCHWPQQFVGNLDRTYTSFLGEATNPVHSVRMLLKVGGADPTHGPVGGIHWHMNVGNQVQYAASDESRQVIPYVRVTSQQGVVREFRSRGFTNEVQAAQLRTMDCMDCHNRPAHVLKSPNDAVNLAMSLGQINTDLPYIKTNAVFVLTRDYQTESEALQGIATTLASRYPNGASDSRVAQAISAVQEIYRKNFFPEMRASWKVYPNNIGHKDWPGCFRCHDGKHVSADGRDSIKANDCNACHIILSQGSGDSLKQLSAEGLPFEHPGGEYEGSLCNECHDGAL